MGASIEYKVTEGTGKNQITYNLVGDKRGEQTLEGLAINNQNATFSIAREVLKEEQVKGFPKKPRVRTDGRFEKPDTKVLPFGRIEYYAQSDVGVAILDMFRRLHEKSPMVSGQYREQNVLYHNGLEQARTPAGVASFVKDIESIGGFKPGDELRMVNLNPYARKLEYYRVTQATVGRRKGKQNNKGRKRSTKTGNLLPSGTYYLTGRAIKRRYRAIANFINIGFMRSGDGGITIGPVAGSHGNRTSFEKDGRPYLYPYISIRLSAEGIL